VADAPAGRWAALLSHVGQWGRQVSKGTPFEVVVGIGLVTYGFVYLLVAAIAVRIAVTGQRGADSPLLVLKAIGLTAFGVDCLAWAANRRR
jgi:hypothetical protein